MKQNDTHRADVPVERSSRSPRGRASGKSSTADSGAASQAPSKGTDGSLQAADATTVSRGLLDELLAGIKSDIAESNKKEIQTATSRMEANVNESFSTLIRRVDGANQERFASIEENIRSVEERTGTVEQDQQRLREQVERMSKVLALAEEAIPPPDPKAEDFDRDPDRSVIRINTDDAVHKHDLKATIDEWLHPHFKASDFVLRGPDVEAAKFWSIKFTGALALAASRAKKSLDVLKQQDGSWVVLKTHHPATKEKSVTVYVSPDKSPKQKQTEFMVKKLAKIFRDKYPTRSTYFVKKTGVVAEQGKAIARVIPRFEADCIIEWNAIPPGEPINKQEVIVAFRKATACPAVQWESI